MAIRFSHLQIAMFVLFLTLPLLLLVIFGVIEERGQPHPEFPSVSKVLRARKQAPDQFGNAVLQRSLAARLAIQAKNWTTYDAVGFVAGPKVFSGRDGWLFYYEDFNDGRCLDEAQVMRLLRRLAAVIDMGRAGGIDVIASISPDKSTIYPEMLNDTWRGYWRCRVENGTTLRRLIATEAPMIIDHTAALLAEKVHDPSISLYFPQDTHWTRFGREIAVRHLLSVLYPNATLPRPEIVGVDPTARSMDLLAMLQIPAEVPQQVLDDKADDALQALNRDRQGYRTALIHDSFYGSAIGRLKLVYPDLQRAAEQEPKKRQRDLARDADRLIINVVERNLLRHIDQGIFAGNPSITTGLIDRNVARAAACAGFAEAAQIGQPNASIAIPEMMPAQLPCLRIAVRSTGPADLALTLPGPAGGAPVLDRSIRCALAPGQTIISFVLPAYTAGAAIDLNLDSGTGGRIETVAVGSLVR